MEEDCVSGLFSIFACCFRCEQDLEVSAKDNKPNQNQIHNIGIVPPLDDAGMSKSCFPEAEHIGIKVV